VNRRSLIAVCGGLGTALLAGCAGDGTETFEPDVSETRRLGAAEPTVLDGVTNVPSVGDDTFERQATVTANVRVHDHVGSLLRDRGLLGGGVFPSIERVAADEIEGDVQEAEFERAIPIATVVNQRYVYDEDGELSTRSPVDLDTLRGPLPRTVGVEVSYESDRYGAVLPVVVHRYWVRSGHERARSATDPA
jgi:hypothetical protein